MLELGYKVDGKYKILGVIGQGGMSTVYLAINERANKKWAIKEVRKDGVADFEIIRQSQMMETNLLKKLSHPNLPSIIDIIDQPDSFLIVMDYIEGRPLSELLREKNNISCEDVIEWAKQLCDVLEYLHTRKPPIIYRDMKPANIMLQKDGRVKLIDFGIAREFKEKNIEDTTCLGTRGYAAPEQFGGQGQTDARTDIYCLGATIYHLVTGHNPSEPPYEMYPIRHWDKTYSSGLEKIILKCTRKNPDDRYQSCDELLYALNHYKEEDDSYRKKLRTRWRMFCSMVVMSFVMLTCSAFCLAEKNKMTDESYKRLLSEASATRVTNERFPYYEKAISLLPDRSEAYMELIDTMSEDGIFSAEESEEIRRVIPPNEAELKRNIEGYVTVSYKLGMLYFYYPEDGNVDVKNASKWLSIAAGEGTDLSGDEAAAVLGQRHAYRVKLLYGILQYYRELDTVNKEGDSMADYARLWEDLRGTVSDDIAELDNSVTALVMYNFFSAQVAGRAKQFKKADVSYGEISAYLDSIEKNIEVNGDDSYETELFMRLAGNIEFARKNAAIAYEIE